MTALKNLTVRRFLAALAFLGLLTAGFVGMPAGDAEAAPSKMIYFYYYDSPAKTNLVGMKLISCWHGTSTSGQVTSYYDREEEPCSF